MPQHPHQDISFFTNFVKLRNSVFIRLALTVAIAIWSDDYTLLNKSEYLAYAIFITIVVSLLEFLWAWPRIFGNILRIFHKEKRWSAIFVLGVTALPNFFVVDFALTSLNGILDDSATQTFSSKVLARYQHRYTLDIQSQRNPEETDRVQWISKDVFAKVAEGDFVLVTTRRGKFGWPWVVNVERAQDSPKGYIPIRN